MPRLIARRQLSYPVSLLLALLRKRLAESDSGWAVKLVRDYDPSLPELRGDPDRLTQALINLVRNAVDAALETGGGVQVGWARADSHVEVWIRDEGPGLSQTTNLFVPFFTTKPNGTGIGLVLSRQIAEAHGGSLTLENRTDARGCEARLRLPVEQPE